MSNQTPNPEQPGQPRPSQPGPQNWQGQPPGWNPQQGIPGVPPQGQAHPQGWAHPSGQPSPQSGARQYGQGQPPPGQQYAGNASYGQNLQYGQSPQYGQNPQYGQPGQAAGQHRTQWDPTQPFPQPGQPGRDPRAPMGAPIPAAVGIEQFEEKRSRMPAVAAAVVLALVALGIVLGVRAMSKPAASPTSSAAPSITVTPQSTAGNNALSVPFDNDIDESSGTWAITNYQWSGDNLVVTLSVHADKGTQAMRFFAISNDSETRSYDPASSGRADDLLNKQVAAGTTLKGTVSFAMPHQASTIFLTAANGRQVSALVVPA